MAALLVRLVVVASAFLVVDAVMGSVHVSGGIWGALGLAALYGVVSVVVGGVARLLTLPLRALTLGLFDIVITAGLLLLTSWLTDWLVIDGIVASLVAAVVFGVAAAVIGFVASRLVAG